jgi:phosphatidate cytidylyltransferase
MPAADPEGKSQQSARLSGFLSRELRLRIASGAAMAAVAIGFLYLSAQSFIVLVAVVAAIMSLEWGHIVRGRDRDLAAGLHVACVLVVALLTAMGMAGAAVAVALLGAGLVTASLVGSAHAQLSGAGVLYTGLPVVALGWIRGDEPGFLATAFLLLCVVATDVFAFFAGRSIGGPKLWPSVSPNKTWAGFIGGVSAAALVGALFPLLTGSGSVAWLAGFGLLMGVVSQGGDLLESSLKRRFGLKDAGCIIPGHGGFMDRMDGVVSASILAACIALSIDAYAPARAILYGS